MKTLTLAMLLFAAPALAHDPEPKPTPKIHYQPPRIEKKQSLTPLWIALAAVGTVAIIMANDNDERTVFVTVPCEPVKKCER